MEVIDIGFNVNDLEPITLNINDDFGSGGGGGSASSNFGPGIELLMNDKIRSSGSGGGTSVDLGDMEKLERELNDLTQESKASSDTRTLTGFASNLFNFGAKPAPVVSTSESGLDPTDSKLGSATAESIGNTKTWDGFSKIGDVPGGGGGANKMTDRERRRKKRAMLKKLDEWYAKGQIKNSNQFNMDSPYDEIEDEFESVMEDKRRKDSVKLQGWWFMTFINSIEYGNAVFDPFGLNLDGWGEQISEDIESYEDIFGELYEKYKGGKLSPEISLLLRIGFSAAVVNITNKALSTATPGFNDVIRQSPELMKMFSNATVQSMSQNMGGMGGGGGGGPMDFVNSILNPGQGGGNAGSGVGSMNTMFGSPPPPVDPKSVPPPTRPGQMQFTQGVATGRPDIAMGRGSMFREEGVNVENNFQSTQTRPEMRGPQNLDINNLLSGLKTREVNIHESSSIGGSGQQERSSIMQNQFASSSSQFDENDSLISISSLKDSQNTMLPKRANKRKNKSDRNTISLDI